MRLRGIVILRELSSSLPDASPVWEDEAAATLEVVLEEDEAAGEALAAPNMPP
jgi:hypothetical protein